MAALCTLTTAISSAAQRDSYIIPPFTQYEPILERMPFGDPPSNSDHEADPDAARQDALLKAEQENLARKINMSAVNITPQGETAIGFTDLSTKPPVNYYLVVGAESGGWRVNSADYEAEVAEIERDGVAIALQLGKGLVEKTSTAPALKAGTHAGSPRLDLRKTASLRSVLKPPSSNTPPAPPSSSAAAIRDKLRSSLSLKQSSELRSYTERLKDRKMQEDHAINQAKELERRQLEKLAREVASKEIKKQADAIAREAELEKEIALENEIARENEIALEKEQEKKAEK